MQWFNGKMRRSHSVILFPSCDYFFLANIVNACSLNKLCIIDVLFTIIICKVETQGISHRCMKVYCDKAVYAPRNFFPPLPEKENTGRVFVLFQTKKEKKMSDDS